MSLALLLVAGGCSRTDPVSTNQDKGDAAEPGAANGSMPTAVNASDTISQGEAVRPAALAPPFKYNNASIPDEGSKCDFEEHDVAERPKHYVPASRDSNIIFYQRPKGPLWSDVDPNKAIAELEGNELIVAARYKMRDLWIRPKGKRVTLEAGEKKLTCY